MEFVSIRKMDELGRIILPVEIRRLYGIGVGDTLGIEATLNMAHEPEHLSRRS